MRSTHTRHHPSAHAAYSRCDGDPSLFRRTSGRGQYLSPLSQAQFDRRKRRARGRASNPTIVSTQETLTNWGFAVALVGGDPAMILSEQCADMVRHTHDMHSVLGTAAAGLSEKRIGILFRTLGSSTDSSMAILAGQLVSLPWRILFKCQRASGPQWIAQSFSPRGDWPGRDQKCGTQTGGWRAPIPEHGICSASLGARGIMATCMPGMPSDSESWQSGTSTKSRFCYIRLWSVSQLSKQARSRPCG